jgi:arylsulfatase A-like enzyme
MAIPSSGAGAGTLPLAGLFVGALMLTGACSGDPPSPTQPDVVVIVVDTLRADRLSFYGCPVETAPFLASLAERSLVFENAWSPSSWTLPATVSMLTSVHPFQHGVRSLEGLELGPDDEPQPVNRIPDGVQTLAETLRAEGYRTLGIASNILVGEEVGFERGFDAFVRLDDEDASWVNEQLEAWRGDLEGEGPVFLYLHYFDPHDPFHARAPWFDVERSAAGWSEDLAIGGEHTLGDLDWILTRLEPQPEGLAGRSAVDLSQEEVRAMLDWIRAAYDSEIGFVDDHIRQAYQSLGMEEAVVVFLSDHGEEFYEHGDITHGQNLYGETTRVPLLIQLPGDDSPRGRRSGPVSTLDVVPTLRSILGLPPSEQDQGKDLLEAGEQGVVLQVLEDQSGQHDLEQDLRSLVFGNHRIITTAGGHVELYDLAKDPLERRDVSSEHPDLVEDLLDRLDEAARSTRAYPRTLRIPAEGPSPAMLEHLKGVGYLGGDR